VNDDVTTAVCALAVMAGAAALIWLAVITIRVTKRGGGGMRGIGAALMMLGSWGTMRDPGNNTVAEAQDGRVRKGETSGDPLDREPPAK
jgi:hypothetical protein